MITLTREEAQQVLNMLYDSVSDNREWNKRCEWAAAILRAKLKEPTIDGWPLYSGLPPIKVQDELEANYKSFAQSAQVIGGQYDHRREWVGLTDDEISELILKTENTRSFFRIFEAKLKEKNGF